MCFLGENLLLAQTIMGYYEHLLGIYSNLVFLMALSVTLRYWQDQSIQAPQLSRRMRRRDFVLTELNEYNGVRRKRILVAVAGDVFDVTDDSELYGPNGLYKSFGGRDASRALVTSNPHNVWLDRYDDLRDLSTSQMNDLTEWRREFGDSFECVGKLIRPTEPRTSYSDEESDTSESEDDD
ncbi:membrane-associated progesterone receptor component 2 isoform X1 [Aethina tumida]|uniref:membrane-associated progesterone receptor component 2 isoform X1 n=2 Tax=Aethina tumida TaxID=116153 RepID=UPI002148CF83|nr:membrane-associated progesterone receptor component 2 isoform X1 [Aethina tumida]